MKRNHIIKLALWSCIVYNLFFWIGMIFFHSYFIIDAALFRTVLEEPNYFTVGIFYNIFGFFFFLYLPAIMAYLSREFEIDQQIEAKKRRVATAIFITCGIFLSVLLWYLRRYSNLRIEWFSLLFLIWAELYSLRFLYYLYQGQQNQMRH